MYVRGLTADINHLEAKKDSESSLVSHLETHLATIFAKLSTLFSGILDLAARECMFSAFSLRPTKERLYILQSLTQNLLSGDNKKEKSVSLSGYEGVRYCNCRLQCVGPCRTILKDHALNPLLNLGVKSVSYHLIKDLVCVLESARSIKFQYNMFDWQSNITDLGDYLKTFYQKKMTLKDWGSDTEVASDEDSRSDSVTESENTHSLMTSSGNASIKRKSESCTSNPCALQVAANVEVESNDGVKRKKVQDQKTENKIRHISEITKHYSHANSNALETIIKATLTESRGGDKRSAFSEVKRQSPISHTVYPYSLTDHGKRENLNTAHRMSSKSSMNRIKSSVECQSNLIRNYANESHNVVSSSASLGRQSVVITHSNHASTYKPVFLQQDPRKTLPYSIQSSGNQVQRQVNKNISCKTQNVRGNPTAENALNLSCNPDYQRNKHLQQFPSQKSQSSSPVFHPKYTNLPNSTDFTSCSSKQQVYHDRNSVIRHTMQHVVEKPIPISRELLVSLDPSTKIRKLNESSYPSNAKNKILSKPENPSYEKFVVPNSSHSKVASSHANYSSFVKTEALTVPGNFSAATKDNRKLQFSEISNTTTITTSVKKVYKPYAQALPSNPQTHLQRNAIHTSYDGNGEKYQKETIQNNSWSRSQWSSQNNSVVSSSNQDMRWKSNDNVPSNCQQWNPGNAVTSTNHPIRADHSVPYDSFQQKASNYVSDSVRNKVVYQEESGSLNVPASSNQAWYSNPHNQLSTYNRNPAPLLNNSARPAMSHSKVSLFSETNSPGYSKDKLTTSMSILKSRLAPSQGFSPTAQNESYIHPNNNTPTSAESYRPSQINFSPQGLAELSSKLPHTQISSAMTSSYNANSLSASQSESCYNHDMYNNPVLSTDERGVVVFRAANAVQPSNYSHPSSVSSSNTQKVCCSPLEVDPCQSCSPTDSGVQKQEHDFSGERHPYQVSLD